MKKNKGQMVDNFYTTKNVGAGSASSRKQKRKNVRGGPVSDHKIKKKSNKNNNQKQTIDLNNEIIIGLTPKKEQPKNKKTVGVDASAHPNKRKKTGKKTVSPNKPKRKTVGASPVSAHKTIKLKIIKWTTIIIIIITSVVLFMLSSIFNIKQITVSNNNQVSSQEIISLSGLKIQENMFKILNKTVEDNIKENPYIESVKVQRNLNGQVNLEITERKPTFMLQFANAFVYINNQGYMLQITEIPLELPIIIGFKTDSQNIKAGNRLAIEDLKCLENIIKIMDSAKSNSMENLITQIDITDTNNFKLLIATEGKTVQFGEVSDINIKLLRIKKIIEDQKGIEGEIYFQDKEKTVFKEKV